MGLSFLFWAYALTTGLVFAYVLTIAARQSKLDRDIQLLKHQLEGK